MLFAGKLKALRQATYCNGIGQIFLRFCGETILLRLTYTVITVVLRGDNLEKGIGSFTLVSGIIGIVAFFCFFFSGQIGLNHIEKIICSFIMFAFGFMCVFSNCAKTADDLKAKKKMWISFVVFLILYTVILFDFTLIDDTIGRDISNIFSLEPSRLKEYVKSNTNFIPFKTVKLFISAYRSETLSVSAIVENIVGNFFVMMPFALFMPCVFKRINSKLRFFIFCFITVVLIELLQFVFLTGSTDIDDLILNVAGGMTAYLILQISAVKEIISRFTFGLFGGEQG